jgi:hypothetical protein
LKHLDLSRNEFGSHATIVDFLDQCNLDSTKIQSLDLSYLQVFDLNLTKYKTFEFEDPDEEKQEEQLVYKDEEQM